MNTQPIRPFTLPRIIALVLIAAMVMALVSLRLGSAEERVSLPEGAKAGDLALEPCIYEAEDRSYDAECGTLVVAEDSSDPESNLVALPVLRVHALTHDPQEPVFFLTGGPGLSNMDSASEIADRYIADRDFVAVGYRGADGSVRLDCPEVSRAVSRSTDILSDDSFTAVAEAYGSCATRFAGEGIDVTRYGLVQQVDDMETARAAFGYDRINLLSDSAGTRTAMIYAWRHPQSIHRSVMVGVNPPGAFLLDPEITDEQLNRFATLCAADDACRARTSDLTATMRRTAADFPSRWLFLRIKESNLRAATVYGMLDTAPSGPESAPVMIDSWLSAAEGDASGFWFTSVLVDVVFGDFFIAGQRAAAASIDYEPAREYFSEGPGDLSNLGRAATASAWSAGRWVGVWPAADEVESYQQMRTSDVETLVVNGALDVMTPPQWASNELMPYLPNGEEVVLPGFGHVGSFFNQQPEAGNHLVNRFFDTGRVDDSRYESQGVDFPPPMTYGSIAKITLGAMVALAAVAVLSLLGMARRVRRRGRIGSKSGAVLRSVFPVVLGLGGWFLGALTVLTTMPTVSIDNQLLVVASVGVPVGLGIYWAWVQRDWVARTKRLGLAVAAAGAFAGAWLGFHSSDGLLGPLTAIAGAIAGANLTLILLDISRTVRGQPASTSSSMVDSR